MFRRKRCFHTGKVILMTSLVWMMLVVAVLTLFFDCSTSGGWGCSLIQRTISDSEFKANVKIGSKGRGALYEHLHDRGKVQEKLTYDKNSLKRWRPAPSVPEHSGRPGEMGRAVHIPKEKQSLMKEKFKLNQFNLLASDMISLNRSLSDIRQEG